MQPDNQFLYLIEDGAGLSYYYENGVLAKNSIPTPLENNPDGWEGIEFSFDTNIKYFGLFRTVSTPFKFVREGATILRELAYNGKGFSTDAYLRIVEKVRNKDRVYALCYYGKLDFSPTSFKDDIGTSVSINTVEGGLKSFLDANDSVTYDLTCSNNVPKWIKIYFDGVTLLDKYNYSIYNQDDVIINTLSDNDFTQTIGIVFLNNEGDSVGGIHGDPIPEDIGSPTYFTDSANYLFKSVNPISIKIEGTFNATLRVDPLGTTPINPVTFNFFLKTGTQSFLLGTRTITAADIPTTIIAGETVSNTDVYTEPFSVDINRTINLAAEEALFVVGESVTTATYAPRYTMRYTVAESPLSISFSSKNVPTTAYARKIVDVGQDLVDKMSGKPGEWIFRSDYFAANDGMVYTSGDALRNTQRATDAFPNAIKDYYFEKTFENFHKDCQVKGPMAIQITGNVLRMEPLGMLYGPLNEDGEWSTVLELGEISNASLSPIKDRIVNSLVVGYKDQTYDQRAGKYEFNSEENWKLPTDIVKAELNLLPDARADWLGIELIRSNYTGQDSTDNGGDKQSFLVVVKEGSNIVSGTIAIAEGINTTTFTVPTLLLAHRFLVGETFQVDASDRNNGFYIINSVSGTAIGVTWAGRQPKAISAETSAMNIIFSNYILLRPDYDSITGVPDNTVFNTTISPKSILLNWGSYFHSIFYQQPGDQITPTSAKKNNQLTTTLNGITISESAPITIGDLPAPFFLPWELSFTIPVAYTFLQTMSAIGKGDIHCTSEGKDIYLIAIGSMSQKPGTQEAEKWRLVVSPRTPLMTLLGLSDNGTVLHLNNNSMYRSDLQPIHWVQYDYQKKPGIQQLQPWQDWVENRFPTYITSRGYAQKWKTSDTIKVWFVTKGISELTLYVYDEDAKLVTTYPLVTLTSLAVSAPELIKYCEIPLTAFAEGCYLFTIQSGAQILLISECQEISTYHADRVDDTMLIKYKHSYNKSDYYQELGELQLRVEAAPGIPDYKGELVDYTDDQRTTVLLNGKTYETRPYSFGFPYGLPDWMHKKLNLITTLDRISIEDLGVVRDSGEQFEKTTFPGYNLLFSSIELLVSDNNTGIVIDDVTGDEVFELTKEVFVDLRGWGDNPSNLLSIEVKNT